MMPFKYIFCFQTKLDLNVCALATALEDGKFCTGEDITLVLCEFSKLKVLLEAFDPRLDL